MPNIRRTSKEMVSPCFSISFLLIRKIQRFHIGNILLGSSRHDSMQIGIHTKKLRFESLILPHHIVYDKYLSVAHSSTYTDSWDREFGRHPLGKPCRNLFENKSKIIPTKKIRQKHLNTPYHPARQVGLLKNQV